MPTYKVTGINVGSFNLGEADRLLTIFTAERGLVRAVAKGARKPGSKMSGRSEPLTVNRLFLSTGRSLDIITQAETVETFQALRHDLTRLSYGLYYAELTQVFGGGLEDDSREYFQLLVDGLAELAGGQGCPAWQCLRFEFRLLELIGYRPELTYCVLCREVLTDFRLGAFQHEWGGIACSDCMRQSMRMSVREGEDLASQYRESRQAVAVTPLVWKQLVLAAEGGRQAAPERLPAAGSRPLQAAGRLLRSYIEHRAGRRMKALDLVGP